MPAISDQIIDEFCGLCNWAYEAWVTHRDLFDENPHATEFMQSFGGPALGRLSCVTQEYVLHQIAKLHDPAVQGSQVNLGVDYIVKFGGWSPEVKAQLEQLQADLTNFSLLLRSVRNKLLSHNDLPTILNGGEPLGSFPAGKDAEYFLVLQRFVDIVHDQVKGGPYPFNDLAENDVAALLTMLRLGHHEKD